MLFAMLQQSGAQPGFMPQLILIGGMVLLFYFLLIRPQNRARKQMEERLSKLKAGDEVLLSSGFFATIDRVDERDAKIIYLKLGNSIVKAKRHAVASLAGEPEPQS